MRFHVRLLGLLCVALGCVPSVRAATVTIHFVNNDGATHTINAYENVSGSYYIWASQTVSAHSSVTQNNTVNPLYCDTVCGFVDGSYATGTPCADGCQTYGTCPALGPFTFTAGALTPDPCTNWVAHIQWCNNQPGHWAAPILLWSGPAGQVAQDGNHPFSALAPGACIDEYVTNNSCALGFNPNGWVFGDSRPGGSQNDTNGVPVLGPTSGSSTNGLSGNGGNNGGNTPTFPGQGGGGSTQGGNTNLTGTQFFQGTAGIIAGVASVESALRDIQGTTNGTLGNMVSQGTGITNLLKTIDGDIGAGNGLLNAISNGLASGSSSNVFVLNQPTNYLNWQATNAQSTAQSATNLNGLQSTNGYLAAVATNQFRVAAGFLAGVSNAWWVGTNSGAVVGAISNSWGSTAGVVGGMSSFAGGVTNSGSSFASAVTGAGDGGGTFGAITVGNTAISATLDLKKALGLGIIETGNVFGDSGTYFQMTGIIFWVRLVFLWASLLYCISWYVAELKESCLRIMTVPQAQMSEGAGLVDIVTAGLGVKAILALVMSAILFFLPSIVVAGISTVYMIAAHDSSGSVAQAVTLTGTMGGSVWGGIPSAALHVAYLLDQWMPLHENVLFVANLAAASYLLDAGNALAALLIKFVRI